MNEADLDVRAALGRYLRILKRQWWVIVATLLLSLVLTALLLARSSDAPATGESTAPTTDARSRDHAATVTVTLANGPPGSQLATNVSTESQLIGTAVVAQRVRKAVGSDTSIEELLANLTVAARAGTEIIDVTYQGESTAEAEEIARAFVEQYAVTRQKQARLANADYVKTLRQNIREVERRLVEAQGDAIRSTLIVRLYSLEDSLSDLRLQRRSFASISSSATAAGASVPTPAPTALPGAVAPVDTQPASKKKQLAAAGVLGLLLGIGLALIRETFDDRVHDSEQIEALGLPVLGTAAGPDAARTSAAVSALAGGRDVVLMSCGADSRAIEGWVEGARTTDSILDSAEAVVVAAGAKAIALVARLGMTTGTELKRSIEEVRRMGGEVVGVLLV